MSDQIDADMEFKFWHRCPECLRGQWWSVATPFRSCSLEGCTHVPGARWIARRAAGHGWSGDVATLTSMEPESGAEEPAQAAVGPRKKAKAQQKAARKGKSAPRASVETDAGEVPTA